MDTIQDLKDLKSGKLHKLNIEVKKNYLRKNKMKVLNNENLLAKFFQNNLIFLRKKTSIKTIKIIGINEPKKTS